MTGFVRGPAAKAISQANVPTKMERIKDLDTPLFLLVVGLPFGVEGSLSSLERMIGLEKRVRDLGVCFPFAFVPEVGVP